MFATLQRNPTDVELETIPRDLVTVMKRPVYVSLETSYQTINNQYNELC